MRKSRLSVNEIIAPIMAIIMALFGENTVKITFAVQQKSGNHRYTWNGSERRYQHQGLG